MLVALAHAVALERGDGMAGKSHEDVAGRLELAAQLVKQVCCAMLGWVELCWLPGCVC